MSTTTRTGEKRTALEHLSFSTRTNKRVTWEAWSFRLAGPYQIEVCNESYGYQKADHTYVVGVEERGNVVVPAECSCPADIHGEDACKHRVACATVAGTTVLNAAVSYETPTRNKDDQQSTTTARDVLANDSALLADTQGPEDNACKNQWCEDRDADSLPCFACFESTEGK